MVGGPSTAIDSHPLGAHEALLADDERRRQEQ